MKRTFLYAWLRSKRVVRQEGVLSLYRKIAGRMQRSLFRTTCSDWYVRSLARPAEGACPGTGITVDFLVEDKTPILNWLRDHHPRYSWMYLKEEIDAARENAHIFVTLSCCGEIAGYIKVGIGNVYIHDFRRRVAFPPGAAFVYDTFVLPSYREKHLALYGIQRIIDYLRERDFTRLWCHIEPWNHASIRTFTRAGFQKRGALRFSTVLGLPIFIKNGCRPVGRAEDILR